MVYSVRADLESRTNKSRKLVSCQILKTERDLTCIVMKDTVRTDKAGRNKGARGHPASGQQWSSVRIDIPIAIIEVNGHRRCGKPFALFHTLDKIRSRNDSIVPTNRG